MGLSILILILILFEVFMNTSEGVSSTAKAISIGIGIVGVVYIIFSLF